MTKPLCPIVENPARSKISKENKATFARLLVEKTPLSGISRALKIGKTWFWIWFALNHDTREIVSVHLGDRTKESAKKLWDSLPDA